MVSTHTMIAAGLLALASALAPPPARAQVDPQAPRLALKGYDVVAYFSGHKAQPGSAALRTDFDGMRYQFSSAQNKAAFGADPDRYLPQFGGYCAMGISKGKKFESDPTLWKIIDGKLYVFSSPAAVDAAGKDPDILTRARQQWDAMK